MHLIKKKIQTDTERDFYERLTSALPDCNVFPQVAMNALLNPAGYLKSEEDKLKARRSFSQKVVDYAICQKESGEVLALVELDDWSHDTVEAKERDLQRDSMLQQAGYKTLRWDARRMPDESAIRESVLGAAQCNLSVSNSNDKHSATLKAEPSSAMRSAGGQSLAGSAASNPRIRRAAVNAGCFCIAAILCVFAVSRIPQYAPQLQGSSTRSNAQAPAFVPKPLGEEVQTLNRLVSSYTITEFNEVFKIVRSYMLSKDERIPVMFSGPWSQSTLLTLASTYRSSGGFRLIAATPVYTSGSLSAQTEGPSFEMARYTIRRVTYYLVPTKQVPYSLPKGGLFISISVSIDSRTQQPIWAVEPELASGYDPAKGPIIQGKPELTFSPLN